MTDRTNGKTLSVQDFSHAAYDRAKQYMDSLEAKIPGYGKQPTSLLTVTMSRLYSQKEKDGLIEWAAGRLSRHIISLTSTMGNMLLLHAKKYVLRKFSTDNPFNCPEISQIVHGVPFSISRNPKAKLTIANQSENQRAYLQCLADYIELFACISCLDQVLEADRRVRPRYTACKEDDPIFKPCSLAIRAAYELRIFFAIWDIQMDAKAIIEAENSPPEYIETSGYHTTDPVPSEEESDSDEEPEPETESSNETTETESDSNSEEADTGYMEAEEDSAVDNPSEADGAVPGEGRVNNNSKPEADQAVPDLSEVDDTHAAFLEAVQEFLDKSRRRSDEDPNSRGSSSGAQNSAGSV